MTQPDKLADLLDHTAEIVRTQLTPTRQRFYDWSTAGRMPSSGVRGGGVGDAGTNEAVADAREDRMVARYHAELLTLERRMVDDMNRLGFLVSLANPPVRKNLATRDMLAAQVAADGWCVSCWRDDQHLTPIALRTSGPQAGTPYYRDRCRTCGAHKAETGQDPTLDDLRTRHAGRHVRVKV